MIYFMFSSHARLQNLVYTSHSGRASFQGLSVHMETVATMRLQRPQAGAPVQPGCGSPVSVAPLD